MNDATEIIKSVAHAADNLTDLLHKLAGPMAEEVGLLLGDKVRAYRQKNLSAVFSKTARILNDAAVVAAAVPPRLLLPIVEASSLEDNEVLRELWAGLLATASQDTDEVSPSFIETLKQLTPNEALYFQSLAAASAKNERNGTLVESTEVVKGAFGYGFAILFQKIEESVRNVPSGVHPDTYERLGLFSRHYVASSQGGGLDLEVSTDLDYSWTFTAYAVEFLAACQGPSQGIQ